MGNAVFLGDKACCALAGDVEEGGGIQDAVVLGVRGFDIDFEHFGEVVVEECAVVISFGVHEVEAVFFAFEPGLPVVGFVGAVGGVFEGDGKGDFHCRIGFYALDGFIEQGVCFGVGLGDGAQREQHE